MPVLFGCQTPFSSEDINACSCNWLWTLSWILSFCDTAVDIFATSRIVDTRTLQPTGFACVFHSQRRVSSMFRSFFEQLEFTS